MESFAQQVIDSWSYQFWIVKRINSMPCKCIDPTSKQPNSKCKLCLGLGCKIKIIRATGTSRESKEFEALRAEFPTVTPKVFYIKSKVFIEKQDLIIDDECLYTVYTTQFHRGLNGEFKYTRCICPSQKMNRDITIKNFKELLNEYKYKH